VRFGVVMLPTDPWTETIERARRVEALGFDHLWTYDHLSWRRYRGRPWFAAIPWLTGIACATTRLRVGTMVASPNVRHPLTLAQEAVTLDLVSGGRLILGVGAGGVGFDSTVFGHDTLSPAERIGRLTEFVEVLDLAFREPTFDYRGAFYTVAEGCIRPDAAGHRVPIAIAAGGPKALALVARHGDTWITLGDSVHGDVTADGTDAAVRAQVRILDEACAAIGRDPATVARVFLAGCGEEHPLASVAAFDDLVGR
jgi:alkanesulfonate monooxygenase SsuD/methylene tetrahydromethanopterin reductase-like flavin-dependent oxidoreductase (luciferase family)